MKAKQNKPHKHVKEQIKIKAALEKCKAQQEEMKQNYLRALADYKNLEHRMDQERFRMRNAVKREFVEQLLPVLDNLDQATVFNTDPGLKMISSLFQKSLQRLGVEEIKLIGTEFDPANAEVIEVVQGEKDNVIVEVVQKAYQIDGSVIRHAKVKVSKTEENEYN